MDNPINLLLIEDDPDDTLIIREMLGEIRPSFHLVTADTLEKGLERLSQGGIHLTLLDLSLPDSRGLDTFLRVRSEAPAVPVVVLTALDDDGIALEAARQGAQDYLIKGSVNSQQLVRSLRYALARSRADAELRSLLLIDDFTGLYNRRGFLMMGEQYLKLTLRTRLGLGIFTAQIDGWDKMAGLFGSHHRDLILIRAAKTMRDTFRQSDLVAYFGDGLFAALTMEAERDKLPSITQRLEAQFEETAGRSNASRTKLRITETFYDPQDVSSTLDELVVRATKSYFPS